MQGVEHSRVSSRAARYTFAHGRRAHACATQARHAQDRRRSAAAPACAQGRGRRRARGESATQARGEGGGRDAFRRRAQGTAQTRGSERRGEHRHPHAAREDKFTQERRRDDNAIECVHRDGCSGGCGVATRIDADPINTCAINTRAVDSCTIGTRRGRNDRAVCGAGRTAARNRTRQGNAFPRADRRRQRGARSDAASRARRARFRRTEPRRPHARAPRITHAARSGTAT